jgi:hypothetical protein
LNSSSKQKLLVDWSVAEDFLEAIGRSSGPIVFAIYPSDASKPCIHIKVDAEDIPRAKIESILSRNQTHSLGFIVNPPSDQPAVWGTKPEHINKAGEIKAWGASNAHIDRAIAVFAECDGNLSREAQAAIPAMAGLPEPTVSVWTGGKSLHHYWIFTPGEEPDIRTFSDLQRRIATTIENVAPDSKPDKSISNASRVMRLPGGIHPSTGERTVVESSREETYTLSEISDAAPAFFQVGTKQAEPSHHWFSDLPKDRQRKLAIEMLKKHVPLRTQAGQGTYPESFAVLAGITHHFGAEEAQQIVIDADWQSKGTWEPVKKILSIGDAPLKASIKRLINTAVNNGWEIPIDIDTSETDASDELPEHTLPFEFLGYNQGKHYYRPKASSQVIELSASAHTKLGLMSLSSSMEFWKNRFTVNERLDWDEAICWMFTESHKKGVFDQERIRGRGAWLDSGRVIFHLGERLLIDNKEQKVSDGIRSYYIYQHGKPLLGPSDQPMGDDFAEKILSLSKKFNWTDQTSAHFLAGWLTLAPVCGGLKWRPHIWITGGKGCGKTTILTSFMKPLLGQIYRSATGGTTEPGLRAALRSDAIPVLFDEFEQNDSQDKQNMQNVLSMARVASSEGGKIIKGSAGGGEANQYEIRSMFCVSSINVGLVQGADKDRFCLLSLERGASDWLDIEAEISELCTEENGRHLVARTLNQLPKIRENAKIFAKILAKNNGQRYGDQHGTLLAGSFSLQADSNQILTEQDAFQYCESIGCFNSEKNKEARDDDEESCLALILESMIPIEGGKRITVLNLIESLYRPTAGKIDGCDETADQILGRYGIKCTTSHLAVANQNTNLERLIMNSQWASGSHKIALKRIKGAESSSTTLHFPGSKKSRATLLPLAALDEALDVS